MLRGGNVTKEMFRNQCQKLNCQVLCEEEHRFLRQNHQNVLLIHFGTKGGVMFMLWGLGTDLVSFKSLYLSPKAICTRLSEGYLL